MNKISKYLFGVYTVEAKCFNCGENQKAVIKKGLASNTILTVLG